MTDSRTLGQSVPKEGLFLMDGIEGLRSLPKHSVDMLLTDVTVVGDTRFDRVLDICHQAKQLPLVRLHL